MRKNIGITERNLWDLWDLRFLFDPLRGEIPQNLIQNLTKSFC